MCSMFAVTKNERKEHRIAVNARTEKFQHIEVFDKPALFTNGRIARDTVPKGWYCYDIRGSDDDPGELCYMEENVVVNHAGSVLMPEKLAMPKSGRLDVRDELGFLDDCLEVLDGFSQRPDTEIEVGAPISEEMLALPLDKQEWPEECTPILKESGAATLGELVEYLNHCTATGKKLNVSEDAAAAMFPALITFCYDAADMNGKRFFWEYILESNSLVFEDAE